MTFDIGKYAFERELREKTGGRNPMKRRASHLIVVFVLLSLASCGPRQGEPVESRRDATPASQKGRQVFERHCGQCHPGGKEGIGPALDKRPLPASMTKDHIRHGVGVMPSFSEKLLPDEELENLMEFIKGLGEHG